MKKLALFILAILFIPTLSEAAVIGKMVVPDNLLKWERQKDLDKYFKAKMILVHGSDGIDALLGLPAKGIRVNKNKIATTINQKLKAIHPNRTDKTKQLNIGGRTWRGVVYSDEGSITYDGFTSYGLTVFHLVMFLESPGIIPPSVQRFLSKITILRPIEPTDAAPFMSKGNSLVRQRKYADALNAFNKAVNADAACPEAYYFRAICYHKMKKYSKAIDDLVVAITLKKDPDFMVEVADIETDIKNFKNAASWLAKALKINPENDKAYQRMARVYYFLGKLDKAIKAGEYAVSLNPCNRTARAGLVQLYLNKKKDVASARKHLKAFRAFQPLDTYAAKLENAISKQAKASALAAKTVSDKNSAASSAVNAALNKTSNRSLAKNDKDTAIPALLPIPPIGDMAALNDFVDTGSITTTMNLLKQLYGKLTPKQEAALKKQFNQYYEYPCDEIKAYFKKLNHDLYRLVMLKTRLSVEMGAYGQAAAESTNALVFQNENMAKAASRNLLRRRQKILAVQQQLAQINYHLNSISTPPNAAKLKEKHKKMFEYLSRIALIEAESKNRQAGNQSSEKGNKPGSAKTKKSPAGGEFKAVVINTKPDIRQLVSKPYSVTYADAKGKKEAVFKFYDSRQQWDSENPTPRGDVVATFTWKKPSTAFAIVNEKMSDISKIQKFTNWEKNNNLTHTWNINLSASTNCNVRMGGVILPRDPAGMNLDDLIKTGQEVSGMDFRLTQSLFNSIHRNQGFIVLWFRILPGEGQREPVVLAIYKFQLQGDADNRKQKPQTNEPKTEMLAKIDLYKLQIQQLTEEIDRYKQMMKKARTKEEKKHYAWMIMGKEADRQQQKDLLTELQTGQFQHTETRWDKVNAEISASRFLEDSRKYQVKIHQAEYRTDMIRKIGELSRKMTAQDELGVQNWADRQRKAALAAGDDAKLAAIYAALQKKYQQNLEQGQVSAGMKTATMDDYLEAAEYVKEKADTAFMIASTIQSGGTMYLYAGYTGLTNGISGGIRSGVEHAVKSINMATMIAGSAYDGYNAVDPRTGKKMRWKGAAKNTAITLALLGVCHVAIKGAVKTCTVAKEAYSKYAFESAITAQEREMSLAMVNQYEAKLLKMEKLVQRGETAAAKEEAILLEKETQKLMANPHAKNYLKYNGSPATQRTYIQYENKVKARVEKRFKKMMEENGWENFELKEFRNAASGDSAGMDWDIGLIEDKLKKMTINGKEVKVIMRNGRPMTLKQFQKEGEKLFRKAYHLETGYSAEGSFANLTTTAHNEAFKDVAILTDPSRASKELADETSKTVKYKADHMLGKHSMGFITKAGKMGEACRGLAKEIRTKLIPNLRQSQNSQKFLLDNMSGVDYFTRLETVLRRFGENRTNIVEAERSVRRLTGKSLDELPAFISGSLKNAIQAK